MPQDINSTKKETHRICVGSALGVQRLSPSARPSQGPAGIGVSIRCTSRMNGGERNLEPRAVFVMISVVPGKNMDSNEEKTGNMDSDMGIQVIGFRDKEWNLKSAGSPKTCSLNYIVIPYPDLHKSSQEYLKVIASRLRWCSQVVPSGKLTELRKSPFSSG